MVAGGDSIIFNKLFYIWSSDSISAGGYEPINKTG